MMMMNDDVDDANNNTVKPSLVATCIERPPFTKTTFFISLEYGFSLKPVLKEPVHKDHFPCFP